MIKPTMSKARVTGGVKLCSMVSKRVYKVVTYHTDQTIQVISIQFFFQIANYILAHLQNF